MNAGRVPGEPLPDGVMLYLIVEPYGDAYESDSRYDRYDNLTYV